MIASPELMVASNFVRLLISKRAQSSSVLLNHMAPISSESLYVPSISNPTYFSIYDSIAVACACLTSSLEFGIPPNSLSVLDRFADGLSGLFILNAR